MGRPVKEKSLTQQDVINAAIACLDKEGEAALGVNRVARELGIKPPAIYKHLDGNAALRRAVALTIWQQYIEWSRQQTNGLDDPQVLLRAGGRATRDFARSHPNRYRVMTQFQLNLQDPETSPLIQEVFTSSNVCCNPTISVDPSENSQANIYKALRPVLADSVSTKKSVFDIVTDS
ncbi:TetR/AcrR family transcriptional regulator [Nostoc sp.]